MGDFSEYQLIIFDFHRTLADSVYFDRFDSETRGVISDLIFRPPNNAVWDKRWMTGGIAYTDVLRHLAGETAIPYEELEKGLFAGIGDIHWNQSIWGFSQSVRKVTKTAIATINNDLFNRFIAPQYNLSGKFDVIANSCVLHQIDKAELCLACARELGLTLGNDKILLIDDKQENIDAFEAAGGEGYLYRNDNKFQEWLQA